MFLLCGFTAEISTLFFSADCFTEALQILLQGHVKIGQGEVWLVKSPEWKHLLLPLTIKKVPPKANKKFMLQKYYNIVAKICQ